MTPARSVAASVVALGLAGTLTVPIPAFGAAGFHAPGICDPAVDAALAQAAGIPAGPERRAAIAAA